MLAISLDPPLTQRTFAGPQRIEFPLLAGSYEQAVADYGVGCDERVYSTYGEGRIQAERDRYSSGEQPRGALGDPGKLL